MNYKNKFKYRIQLFFIFSFIGIIFSLLSYALLYQKEVENIYKNYKTLANNQIESKEEFFQKEINRVKLDILSILENEEFSNFILDGRGKIETQNLFKFIADSREVYFQVRYIDENGFEKIRVDRRDGISTVVEMLQNKSDRDYFIETSKLKDVGSFHISNFDLNIENGKIEKPIKPTVRISTPVYRNSVFRGVLVINLYTETIFDIFKNIESFDTYIYDLDGFYLIHKYDKFNWSRFFSKLKVSEDFKDFNPFVDGFEEQGISLKKLIDVNLYLLLKIKDTKIQYDLSTLENQALLNIINFILVALLLSIIASIIPEKLYRKTLEQEIILEERLSLINKYVNYSKSDLDGYIIEVSDAFCNLCGYTRDELIGKKHSILKSEFAVSKFYDDLWSTILKGDVWQGELINRRKDKSLYRIVVTISEIKDFKNERVGYISIRQDITAQRALEESKLQLLRQSRHVAMGEMISIIAHQWRQPINYLGIKIFSMTSDFINGKLTKEKANKNYEECANTLDNMSKIIDTFRNFFKSDKSKEAFYINTAISKAISLLSHLVDSADIHIEINNSSRDKIYGVMNEVVQVFVNIIKNSYDEFVSKDIEHPIIKIDIFQNETDLMINFFDNAGGVEDEIIKKLFEPYFSTKSNNGTGVGLYMCKLIIEESLKGEIGLINCDKGVKITMKIPIIKS